MVLRVLLTFLFAIGVVLFFAWTFDFFLFLYYKRKLEYEERLMKSKLVYEMGKDEMTKKALTKLFGEVKDEVQ